MDGPKLGAAGDPTKNKPGTEDSNERDSAGTPPARFKERRSSDEMKLQPVQVGVVTRTGDDVVVGHLLAALAIEGKAGSISNRACIDDPVAQAQRHAPLQALLQPPGPRRPEDGPGLLYPQALGQRPRTRQGACNSPSSARSRTRG